jgi:hypothetical protein
MDNCVFCCTRDVAVFFFAQQAGLPLRSQPFCHSQLRLEGSISAPESLF